MSQAAARTEFMPIITKTFDFPVDKVFDAWTKQESFAEWWGPADFTNPICEVDLRDGGAYKIVMRSPDGDDFPCKGEYKTVDRPRRLVFTINTDDHPPEWHKLVNEARGIDTKISEILFEVIFDDLNGKTKVTVTASFGMPEDYDALVKIGMKGGWSQSLEKLQAILQK